MLLTVHRRLATLDIEASYLRADSMRASVFVGADVDDAVLGMLFAECRWGAALDSNTRHSRARAVRAKLVADVDHPTFGM